MYNPIITVTDLLSSQKKTQQGMKFGFCVFFGGKKIISRHKSQSIDMVC